MTTTAIALYEIRIAKMAPIKMVWEASKDNRLIRPSLKLYEN
jgi:hypothetical protein